MNPLFHCPIGKVKALRHTASILLGSACLALATPPSPVPAASAPSSAPSAAVPPTHSSLTGAYKVAIMPFTGEEISAGMLSSVTKRFQSDLESTHSYDIVKRRKLNKFLDGRDPDAGPCQTTACYQEVANQFGVQGVFTGVVSKGSETWRLQVQQIDVATGETTFNHLVEVFGSNNGSLSDNCDEMAKIAGGLKIPESDYTVLDRSGHAVWPWVTGGILVAGGATAAAILLMNDDGGSKSTPKTEPATSSTPDQLIVKW
jgi:Protein of unknown function (DUF2380)